MKSTNRWSTIRRRKGDGKILGNNNGKLWFRHWHFKARNVDIMAAKELERELKNDYPGAKISVGVNRNLHTRLIEGDWWY